MDTLGTFNGADLSQVVLLSTNQFIPGMTTFRNLEVTDELVVGMAAHTGRAAHFLDAKRL